MKEKEETKISISQSAAFHLYPLPSEIMGAACKDTYN